jgi:outer membrane protein OmpA-like peptidoglycan-associated protein
MRKTVLALSLAGLAAAVALRALDLNGAMDAVKDPNALGKAAGNKAAEELSKKLKKVQNQKGPIVFKTGKADLEASKCERTLKAIDGLIKGAPGFIVTIEGHTDNKGDSKVNMELSQKRAEAVVAWLSGHLQTPAGRMEAKGYGDSKPIASNKSAAGRAKNRRVDFSVRPQ